MPPLWQIAYSRVEAGWGTPDLSDPQDQFLFVSTLQEVMEEERDKRLDTALVEQVTAIVMQRVEEGMAERIAHRVNVELAAALQSATGRLKEAGA